ncbi:MAG: polymer-forming cytoskeletal protein [Candidatus Buchananbacteria bacterium]
MTKKFFALLLLLPLLWPAISLAQTTEQIITLNEVREDNFLAVAPTVKISGQVKGDVLVIANDLEINGQVDGDVLAIVGQIKINGAVLGNVRVIGREIWLNNKINKNVTLAGSDIIIGPQAEISGTLAFWAKQLNLAGQVAKRIDGQGQTINLAGQTSDLYLTSEETGKITLSAKAQLGNLTYWAKSDKQLISEKPAKLGVVTYQVINPEKNFSRQLAVLYLFYRLIAAFGLMIVGLVLINLFKKPTKNLVDQMLDSPVISLRWGLASLIVIPLIIIFLLLTIIGVPLAIILAGLYLMGLYLGKVLAALALGEIIISYLAKPLTIIKPLPTLIVGGVVLIFLISLPIIGWLISLLAISLAWGALIKPWLSPKNPDNQDAQN